MPFHPTIACLSLPASVISGEKLSHRKLFNENTLPFLGYLHVGTMRTFLWEGQSAPISNGSWPKI